MGPYCDLGHALLNPVSCRFAIDPHPFQDDNGEWYLFYARDFLDTQEHPSDPVRAGTALMVDRLCAMDKLAGEGRVVMRAHREWQRFQANRTMYGQTFDWHTLEGPCVRKKQGRYYCLYSGGRWDSNTYGVDYAVSDHVLGPYSDQGNERGPRILKTVPGVVLGPGHNLVVLGPDEKTDYIVYHAWDAQMVARRMCLDALIWTPEGPRCLGPSSTPQRIPLLICDM